MKEKYEKIYAQIDESYDKIVSMRPIPEDSVERFLEDFSITSCHNSTAIEGNTFTYDETMLLIKEGLSFSAHSFQEHNEIIGYKKAFDFLYDALKNKTPLSEAFIKKLNSFVLTNKKSAGEYRNIQVYIGNMFQAKYTPPAPEKIEDFMQAYLDMVENDMQEMLRIIDSESVDWHSIFNTLSKHHIEFERIHPFIDGNGRVGRLLLTYEMISLGLLPVDIRYEERERYYAGFKNYEKKAEYSTREDSKTEGLANLIAECELRSMTIWMDMFRRYLKPETEM